MVGAHGGNFAKIMLNLAADRDSLNVVAAHLVRQQRSNPEAFPYGTYHRVAGGETHWCDYARHVIGAAIKAGKPIRVQPEAIKPITTADYSTPAKHPANLRLDTRKFRDAFGLELPHWQAGPDHILQQIF